jgi:hypothetical protein
MRVTCRRTSWWTWRPASTRSRRADCSGPARPRARIRATSAGRWRRSPTPSPQSCGARGSSHQKAAPLSTASCPWSPWRVRLPRLTPRAVHLVSRSPEVSSRIGAGRGGCASGVGAGSSRSGSCASPATRLPARPTSRGTSLPASDWQWRRRSVRRCGSHGGRRAVQPPSPVWDDPFREPAPPDEHGRPEGSTFEEFVVTMRTGTDPEDRHRKLLVMPWPTFRFMTTRDLRASYEYLRAIPPAEPGFCFVPGQ